MTIEQIPTLSAAYNGLFAGMLSGVTCFGKPEETVLATAVLSIALWLLNILHNCSEAAGLVQKASELLKILLTDDFYISMICLAKYNDPGRVQHYFCQIAIC